MARRFSPSSWIFCHGAHSRGLFRGMAGISGCGHCPAPTYRAIAFAQLTYRESLRDIETCLSVQAAEALRHGVRRPGATLTLADANEARDWRIYAESAQRLIAQARRLYTNEDLGFDLADPVYALEFDDHRSLSGRLSPFRTTKAAIKMHRLLDLRGNIPSFIHVSDGKLHDVHASTYCSRKRAPSTSWIAATSISPASIGCISPAPSSSPAPIDECPSRLFRPDRPADRDHLPSDHRAQWSLHQPALPRTPAACPVARCRVGENPGVQVDEGEHFLTF